MTLRAQTIILHFCTILVLCTLYAAQPIQPIFRDEFSLNGFQAAVFTTVIMMPLSIAPLLYGYILESFSAKQMLGTSLLILGVLEVVFSFGRSYPLLIVIRALQGIFIPAALTSIMSYISTTSTPSTVQRMLGHYVAVTIIGGFLGRFLSGISAGYFGWRPFFMLIGILLIILFALLMKVDAEVKVGFNKPTVKEIINVIKVKHNFFLYGCIFCIFFVFQGVLNFLPFELRILNEGVGSGRIGVMYAGYVMGIIIAFNITKIIRFFGSETNAMLAGITIYILGSQLLHLLYFKALFASMFVFCLGMFTVHTIAAGLVNKLAREYKSITNGLYLSFYYSGGTLGTFVPGFIFQVYGWHLFLIFLGMIVLTGAVFWALLNFTLNAENSIQ